MTFLRRNSSISFLPAMVYQSILLQRMPVPSCSLRFSRVVDGLMPRLSII